MRIFKEEQRFTQSRLIILLFVILIAPLALITKKYLQEDSTMSASKFITTIAIIIFFIAFILFLKLSTRIDEKGIYYRFFPFHFKTRTIPWEDFKKVYTRKYNSITEYGGWGLKSGLPWRKSKGVAYNVKGDKGIQLELLNGKKILIGTQKRAEVDRALKSYEHKIITNEN